MIVRRWHLFATLAVVVVVTVGMALLSQRDTDNRICEAANQSLRDSYRIATNDDQNEVTARFAEEAARARRAAYKRDGQPSDLEAARAYEALAVQARALVTIRTLERC
jgi:hypothetical protein